MRRTLLISLCLLCALPMLAAAPKSKPKPKTPVVKTQTKQPARVVKGTTQLDGQNAQFGLTYTIGKSEPVNVTVNSIEYAIGPVYLDHLTYVAEVAKKLMVVHLTIQNPNAADFYAHGGILDVTAVDSKNGNWEQVDRWVIEETSTTLDQILKPGQKLNVKLLISVPASDEIPKLMFVASDRTALRYNLAGKVKPLSAPFADSKDPKGYTPYESISAKIGGDFIPMQTFAIRLDSTSMKPATEEEGAKYMVTVTLTNQTKAEEKLYGSMLTCTLIDTDGGEWNYDGSCWAVNADRQIEPSVKPGQQVTVRLPFTPAEGATAAMLSITDGATRPINWKL
ncbi:MAG: hypothetical protein ACYC1M_16475 [Armatimonadota bacterium]